MADLDDNTREPVVEGDLILAANTWCPDAAIQDGIHVWTRAIGETGPTDVPLYAAVVKNLTAGDTRELTREADLQCAVRISSGRATYHVADGSWLHDLGDAGLNRLAWPDADGWFMDWPESGRPDCRISGHRARDPVAAAGAASRR
jgi:hypothetical protein